METTSSSLPLTTSKRSRPTATTSPSAAVEMFAQPFTTRRHRRRPRHVSRNETAVATAFLVALCPSVSRAQSTTMATSTTMSATPPRATTTQASQDALPDQSQHACPPEYNGWAPSSDCASYFWCSSGQLASIPYDCVEGTLFDAEQVTCLPAQEVACSPVAETASATVAASNASLADGLPDSAPAKKSSPTPPPTLRPTSLGPAIYFVDFPSQSCKTDSPPDWITPDQLFTTKEECCNVMMDWIPLETCLGGANYTETNFFWAPTETPTNSPTWSPSYRPSEAPSVGPSSSEPTISPSTAMPTVMPTLNPTVSPNGSPTQSPTWNPTLSPSQFVSSAPTLRPTTLSPTLSPTVDPQLLLSAQLASASRVENTYLVDLIGWANQGMESYSLEAFSAAYASAVPAATESPTPSPLDDVFSDASLSTLLLPVVADATVSRQRPQANFGSHQALAVDGGDPGTALGDSEGETFDTLLKFDVSLVDFTRPLRSATLRLYVVEGCKSGGTLSTTGDVEWDADTVTWENAPVADGAWVGRLPTVVAGQWYDVDVTSALSSEIEEREGYRSTAQGGNYLSFRFESDENSRCLYSSMEGGDSVSPRLVVQYMEETAIARSDAMEETGDDGEPALPPPPPVVGDFLLLKATDDATVVASHPTRNYGAEPNLLVAFDSATRGIFDTLLRFDLRELVSTPPRTAVLSLYAETDCVSAGTFAATSGDDEWVEKEVTWVTAPVYDGSDAGGTSLGVFGSVRAETWNAFNVLNAIRDAIRRKESAVTFRLSSGNMEPCQFSSRDGGRAPKLMVAF